jgi:hypothetical protein
MIKPIIVNTGDKYNRLTIIKEIERTGKYKCRTFECKCDCGKITNTQLNNLRNSHTTSCGCLKIEKGIMLGNSEFSKHYGENNKSFKHGLSGTREYITWKGIKQRCYNPKTINYHLYGGRGITVCDRWLKSFQHFLDDMGLKPSRQYSIDRIDVNGNYEPSNCRWATLKEQANNKRNNKKMNV